MSGIQQMLLGSGETTVVDFTNQTVAAAGASSATAGYRITTTGEAREVGDQDLVPFNTLLEQGITPGSATSGYEVYATASPAPTNGTLNTWLALTSNREWSNTQAGSGTNSTTLTIEIRPTGGSTVDTWTVDLTANVL